MLLTATDLDLTSRVNRYAEIFRMLTGNAVPVARQPAGSDVTSIHICAANDQDVIKVHTERGSGSEYSYAIAMGARFKLCIAFQEQWLRVAANSPRWERKILSQHRDSNIPTAAGMATGTRRVTGEDWVFNGLGVRYYIQSVENGVDGSIHQWLRCEWPTYRFDETLKCRIGEDLSAADQLKLQVVYDAQNAAHPHFHFDAIPLNAKTIRQLTAAPNPERELDFHAFGSRGSGSHVFHTFPDGIISVEQIDLWRMHLPTATAWKITPFADGCFSETFRLASEPLAHQNYPKDLEEIDNWMSWSLHYFKDQFEKYVMDA